MGRIAQSLGEVLERSSACAAGATAPVADVDRLFEVLRFKARALDSRQAAHRLLDGSLEFEDFLNLMEVFDRFDGDPLRQQVTEVLERVGLSGKSRDKYKKYSLGMKQRLGVAAALLKDPELLILDEPTNGLDPQGMADMRALIRSLSGGERAVLLSSHLMNEVEAVCDRVGIISEGKLIEEGTVAELRGSEGLRIRAEPVDEAESKAIELDEIAEVRREGEELVLAADPDRGHDISQKLTAAGIKVHEMRRERRSLEEVFLELTGKSQYEEQDEGGEG